MTPGDGSPAKPPQRLFVSGHSLTADPFGDDLSELVRQGAGPYDWDRQYLVGSTIQQRLSGLANRGIETGVDRSGRPVDLPRRLSEGPEPFDGLLITERNGLLGEIMWFDSARSLRRFHLMVHRGNEGSTWFFEPWFGLSVDEPERWIAHERASSPIWGCLVQAVNGSLPGGRRDAIRSVPVGMALADLLDRALSPAGVPGVTGATRTDTVRALFVDDVHPTRLATYYTALVVFARVWGQDPRGRWAPSGVSPETAASLQAIAFANAAGSASGGTDLAGCRSTITGTFQWQFWRYINDRTIRPEKGFLESRWILVRHWMQSYLFFRRNEPPNPLSDPNRLDAGWWQGASN